MKANNVHIGLMPLIVVCASPYVGQSLSRADRPEVKVGDAWAYQGRDARTANARLRYEKDMLREWLRQEFAR